MFWTVTLPLEILAIILIMFGFKHEEDLIELEKVLHWYLKKQIKKIIYMIKGVF